MIRVRRFLLGVILSILLISIYGYFIHESAFAVNDPIGSWTVNTPSLPNALANQVSVEKNNKLFIFGGATSDDYSEVYSATTNPNGSLSEWSLKSNLPSTRYGMAKAQVDNKVYVLGGLHYDGSVSFTSNVYMSNIGSDGSLSSWRELISLPQNIVEGEAVAVGSRIYFAGGTNSLGSHDEVYVANVDPNGNLDSWSIISHLPRPLTSFGFVAYKNKIYVIGGNGGGIRSEVYSATINQSNGSLSPWQLESNLIQPFADKNQVIIVGNTIIVVGGADGIGTSSKIYFSKINQDGSITSWQESSSQLPEPIASSTLVYSNGYIYLVGGTNGVGYVDKIFYAKFNNGVYLNVPLLKQTNPLWGGQAYDSASFWSPIHSNISSWGCALTSAVMVFNFHGLNKMVGGADLNPSTVNSWLISQPDGYVGNGLVNWLALSRLSKLVKPNNNVAFDALQYNRIGGGNISQLSQDIQNNLPGILEEPGHFIVGWGEDSGDLLINDPFYNRTSLLSYSNTFISLGRFVPSNTDLSYIMLVTDKNVNIEMRNSLGSLVGESFLQSPLENDENPGQVSGDSTKIFYLAIPENGNYSFNLSSANMHDYKLGVYYYDINGKVKIESFSGIIGPTDNDSFSLKFNKVSLAINTSKQNLSFDDLINDINSLYKTKDINFASYTPLIIEAKLARDLSKNKITKIASINLLKTIQKEINNNKGKGLSNSAYDILNADVKVLIQS